MQANSTTKDLARLVARKLKNAKTDYNQPDEVVLNELFETLFYTSLKTEEGQLIKVTITLIDSENPDPNPPERIVADRWNHIHFDKTIPFTVKNLVKLSKAADPWSSSLAVYYNDKNELFIWGMIDQAIHYQSFLNYESDSGPEQPGLFQATITDIGNIFVMFDYELIANLKQNIRVALNCKSVFCV
ncbi:MAG: putative sensor domain DACNV-containing protein [Janthinobacterium lividum]